MLPSNPFYMGDFYFAGTKKDMISFCQSILEFPIKNLHPSIGTDYILKYLVTRDSNFYNHFLKKIPKIFQIHNQLPIEYWLKIKCNNLSVMPSVYFESLIWRGKLMTDVLPNFKNNFSFFNDWLIEVQNNVTIQSDRKLHTNLLPRKQVIFQGLYEYYIYWKKLFKYYFKIQK